MNVDAGSRGPLVADLGGREKIWLVAMLVVAMLVAFGVLFGVAVLDDPAAPVRYPVRWDLTAGQTLTAQSTSVDVDVEDNNCAGGVPASERLRPTKISYGDQTVTITLIAELSAGFHTCPGRLGADTVTIRLDEPLGDRTFVDGNARGPVMP